MSDESEFDKLLKESLIDVKNILKEKSGKTDIHEDSKYYHKVTVSHDDLYDDIEDIDFLYKKDGIQNKISNNLRSKTLKFKIDEILDLHGLQSKDAENEINSFLEYHYNKNTKYLLIIHGKGTKSMSKKAPIKKLVEKLVIDSPHVLVASSACRNNGGRGATILLMKS